ncbi:hypothetical protein [Methanobacterium spitsbergense]|uniref:Uncharacterized protein n=1 Tax=Methanobacterium spitsbergense TaxID=2874285 RepID=A0A8T5UKX4_9EURY|nr:hypothetical protein [Methanobacterium spitsbergense]MBZ2164482.1 hypothetical protein [Methanobacterium spitsbergense]
MGLRELDLKDTYDSDTDDLLIQLGVSYTNPANYISEYLKIILFSFSLFTYIFLLGITVRYFIEGLILALRGTIQFKL